MSKPTDGPVETGASSYCGAIWAGYLCDLPPRHGGEHQEHNAAGRVEWRWPNPVVASPEPDREERERLAKRMSEPFAAGYQGGERLSAAEVAGNWFLDNREAIAALLRVRAPEAPDARPVLRDAELDAIYHAMHSLAVTDEQRCALGDLFERSVRAALRESGSREAGT